MEQLYKETPQHLNKSFSSTEPHPIRKDHRYCDCDGVVGCGVALLRSKKGLRWGLELGIGIVRGAETVDRSVFLSDEMRDFMSFNSIHSSIHQSIHPFIHQSIHLFLSMSLNHSLPSLHPRPILTHAPHPPQAPANTHFITTFHITPPPQPSHANSVVYPSSIQFKLAFPNTQFSKRVKQESPSHINSIVHRSSPKFQSHFRIPVSRKE